LRSFTDFLTASSGAEEHDYRNHLTYDFGMTSSLLLISGDMAFQGGNYRSFRSGRYSMTSRVSFAPYLNVSFFGTGFTYTEELIKAPLQSAKFNERALDDLIEFRQLIKEVTLGARQEGL
jgi:hypothetical protein